MGTLGGDGGGWPPDNGGPSDGLPELPAEWGEVVIPDDASALAEEAAAVRRELRIAARRRRLRRWLGRDGSEPSTVGVPLLVISMAIMATLASLVAIAWPTRTRVPPARPSTGATTPSADTRPSPSDAGTTLGALRDVVVIGPAGEAIQLRDLQPAVILLVDGCACTQLIADAAATLAATSNPVSLLALARQTAPTVSGQAASRVRVAADPQGAVWAAVPGLGSTKGHGAALVVDGSGLVRATLPLVTSVADLQPALAAVR